MGLAHGSHPCARCAHGCNCASACTAVNGHKVNTVNVQLATVKHILTVVVAAILCILESPQPLE